MPPAKRRITRGGIVSHDQEPGYIKRFGNDERKLDTFTLSEREGGGQ